MQSNLSNPRLGVQKYAHTKCLLVNAKCDAKVYHKLEANGASMKLVKTNRHNEKIL
jgi:hypothetical protein